MQSLKHILNSELNKSEQYNYHNAKQFSIFESILNEFTDDADYISSTSDKFDNNVDKFFESLISHNTKMLQIKLEEQFSKYFDTFIDIDKENSDDKFGFCIRLKNGIKYNDIKCDKDFTSLLKFFNYYLGYSDKNVVPILPIYPNTIDVDFSKCYNLYHFTYKDLADKILKSGLRTKTSMLHMPERIYLYLPKNGKTLSEEEINNFKFKVLDEENIKKCGLSILKFNFYKYMQDYKHPYTLYKDTGMNETEAVYGLMPIPAKYLKEIKLT